MMNENRNKFSQHPPDNDLAIMTPEEERIYRECSREAFVKKGIPYGTVAALGAYTAMKSGLIKSSPKYGYVPVLISASFIGSFVGLVSHKAACIQKVLDLPNSQLRQKLEASRKKYEHQALVQRGLAPDDSHIETAPPMISGLQLDPYQPSNDFDGFVGTNTDGDQRDDFYTMEPLDKFGGTWTTYDEMRQKNREDYVKSKTTRTPVAPDNQRFSKQPAQTPAPKSEGSDLPFDRDRVPQYQLYD